MMLVFVQANIYGDFMGFHGDFMVVSWDFTMISWDFFATKVGEENLGIQTRA